MTAPCALGECRCADDKEEARHYEEPCVCHIAKKMMPIYTILKPKILKSIDTHTHTHRGRDSRPVLLELTLGSAGVAFAMGRGGLLLWAFCLF